MFSAFLTWPFLTWPFLTCPFLSRRVTAVARRPYAQPARAFFRASLAACATSPATVAWADLQSLRSAYGDDLERLIEFLVAPHGFWGHSAQATVAQQVALAASEARKKARAG